MDAGGASRMACAVLPRVRVIKLPATRVSSRGELPAGPLALGDTHDRAAPLQVDLAAVL